MLPFLVIPLHDPHGTMLAFLPRIEAEIKHLFGRAYIGFTAETGVHQLECLERLANDPFYRTTPLPHGSQPGLHYRTIYAMAASESHPEQPLLLCDLDRVIYALAGEHRSTYLKDLDWAFNQPKPVLFQRSRSAWATYPEKYRQIEHLVIQVGELLYGQYYDFGWSHFALRARELSELLPHLTSLDFGILVEFVLYFRSRLETIDVDWLVWEDPFILGCDPDLLRSARDANRAETIKRLRGILPFFGCLLEKAPELRGELQWEKML